MDAERRVAVYGGPFHLTPRQRRRAAKKDRAQKQRPVAWVITREFPGGVDALPLQAWP